MVSKSKSGTYQTQVPLSLEHASGMVGDFVDHYNALRLLSTIGYITSGIIRWQRKEDPRERERQLQEGRKAQLPKEVDQC